MTPPRHPDAGHRWSRLTATTLGLALALGPLTACSPEPTEAAADTAGTVWDSSTVHTLSVEVDEDEYATMLETFVSSDDKEWLSATVTIDGQTFSDVGLRLKGNSSLRSVSTTETEPQDLPWLIRLDKFTDGQQLDGSTDFVVRSSSTQTSLNEAVALELLDHAGLATQEAIATRFSVNGSAETLRLTIENPDDAWDAAEFATEGILYKAEAGGDYSYRGDDPESYTDVFDQESGEDNFEPLIAFLQFINESDDETFAADLSDHLDVDAFATYLAMQDLVNNADDIDGPGNNSYLRYDTTTGAFTVVSWDLNMAFGEMPTGGGTGGGGMGERPSMPDGAELPEGMEPPEGFEPGDGFPGGELPEGMAPPTGERPDGAGAGGTMGGGNILATRFLADAGFTALYDQAVTDLTTSLYASGAAEEILSTWEDVLTEQAGDLVDAATTASEAASVRAALTS